MKPSRRDRLKLVPGAPAAWMLHCRAVAAPFTRPVKITNIKILGLDNLGDGCLVKVENVLGAFRGNREEMARGARPAVRKGVIAVPEGPGPGPEINEDWLRSKMEKGETWWG